MRQCESGFTLVEVMIGMMILTIAIVATTQVLIGQIRFNQQNVDSLSAYYLAQEGVEMMRNVRDTNWLHNFDWLEGGVYLPLEVSDSLSYGINPNPAYFPATLGEQVDGVDDLKKYAPFQISLGEQKVWIGGEESEKFTREIQLLPITDEQCAGFEMTDCSEFALVRSTVRWQEAQKQREISLEEILTNWKDGAI